MPFVREKLANPSERQAAPPPTPIRPEVRPSIKAQLIQEQQKLLQAKPTAKQTAPAKPPPPPIAEREVKPPTMHQFTPMPEPKSLPHEESKPLNKEEQRARERAEQQAIKEARRKMSPAERQAERQRERESERAARRNKTVERERER